MNNRKIAGIYKLINFIFFTFGQKNSVFVNTIFECISKHFCKTGKDTQADLSISACAVFWYVILDIFQRICQSKIFLH